MSMRLAFLLVGTVLAVTSCGRSGGDDDDDDDDGGGGLTPFGSRDLQLVVDDETDTSEAFEDFDYCYGATDGPYYTYSELSQPPTDGFVARGDVPCEQEAVQGSTTYSSSYSYDRFVEFGVDGWAFEVEAGQQVDIAVDTVSDRTTFDPELIVLDPDDCLVGSADDSFECSFPPPDYECPALSFEADVSGEYRVFVLPVSNCTGSRGEYELTVQVSD